MAATVKASTKGLEQVDKARRKKGWKRAEKAWADLACTSQATLKRFWAGIAIQTAAFQAICEAVEIDDWESLVDFKDDNIIQTKISSKRLSFAIAGSVEEIDKGKLDAIIKLLQELGGDATIAILDIDKGSIKLILGGSEEALRRIEALFKSGGLTQIEGVEVENVHFLEKEELVYLIQKNGGTAQNLSYADLSNANLSGADFSMADLFNATLSGADLSKAALFRSDLSYADLFRSDLSYADLRSADLRAANLSYADLSNADLRASDLSYADLSGADLRSADLRDTYLNDADLSGVDLSGATVRGSRMIASRGLSPESITDLKLRGAIFDDSFGDRSSTLHV